MNKAKILIINNGTKHLGALRKLTADYNVRVAEWGSISMPKRSIFDLIILSGSSSFSVQGNETLFQNERILIRESPSSILGICFGCELIADTYKTKLVKMKAKEKGILDIRIVRENPLFDGISSPFQVYEAHRWVTRQLPADLIDLACSDDGIEVIKHKDRQVFGFQFHPEMFPNETAGRVIFSNFLKIVL